jgi:hypothetical protein
MCAHGDSGAPAPAPSMPFLQTMSKQAAKLPNEAVRSYKLAASPRRGGGQRRRCATSTSNRQADTTTPQNALVQQGRRELRDGHRHTLVTAQPLSRQSPKRLNSSDCCDVTSEDLQVNVPVLLHDTVTSSWRWMPAVACQLGKACNAQSCDMIFRLLSLQRHGLSFSKGCSTTHGQHRSNCHSQL